VLAEVEAARRQAATEAAAAEQRRAAEDAAKAEEAARVEKEQARLKAIAGLSPDQIAKAEELANWGFIKTSESSQEFRDHLARFPKGASEPRARASLEGLVWAGLPRPVDKDALKGFLADFPNGVHAGAANAKLAELEMAEREKRETDAWTSAIRAGTMAQLENFRRDWPNSKYVDAARADRNRVDPHLCRTHRFDRVGRVLARRPKRAVWQLGRDHQTLGHCNWKSDAKLHRAY
jgi:hypothetical protein